jgi:PST family polysaccharide transporter
MRTLMRAVFLVGMSSLSNSVIAILRNKFLAVVLGPAGVGLFAQLAGLQTMMAGIVPLGMQVGALRYFALYRAQDPERLARFARASLRMFGWLALGATLVCLVFVRPLTVWAVNTPEPMWLMVPAILGIPFLVQSQTWLTLVQAGLDMSAYSRALVVTAAVGFVAMIPLVLLWKLPGAAAHLLVLAFLGWLVARREARAAMDAPTRRALAAAPFDPQAARQLFHFGAANLLPFALTLAFPFVVRAQIVRDLGVTANGIYQALLAISLQFLAIPLNAMTAYSFPKISQLEGRKDAINDEVNHAVRAAVLVSCAGILAMLLLRDVAVRILFSGDFLAAVPLFPVQLCGDLFRAVGFAVQLPLLPQERYRARNFLALVHYGTFAAIVFAVPPHLRLWGAVWGHTLSWGVHVATHLVYLRKTNGFRFTSTNLRLLVLSCAATGAVAALPFPDLGWRILGLGVAVAWAALAVERREIAQVAAVVRRRLAAAGAADREPPA